MALLIAGSKLLDFHLKFDEKLDELEFTDPEKWAVKWLIKNTLLTTFLICQLCRLEYHVNIESLLKMSSVGIALTGAWIPCLKAYPALYLLLTLLETFFITIGPLYTIPSFLRDLWNNRNMNYAAKRLCGDTSTSLLVTVLISLAKFFGCGDPKSPTFYECHLSIVILIELFWDNVIADLREYVLELHV